MRQRVIGFDTSALDTSFKAHAQRGIGRYVRELNRVFSALPASDLAVLPFDHQSLRLHGSGGVKIASSVIESLPCGRTTLRQQVLFPFQLRALHVAGGRSPDLIHFPAHMDAPAWGMTRYVLTVLDLIPLVCADLYKAKRSGLRFRFARWLELEAIKNATHLVCISESTANDVHRILGVPRERMTVTPLGVDPKFFSASLKESKETVRQRYKLDGALMQRPLVLYVGGIDPRKNYHTLIKSFANTLTSLRQQRDQLLPLLCMVGHISEDREFPKLQALIKQHGLEQDVVCAGFVPDEDLLQLYTIATAFLFPSLYEGFGLPPLEAMAAGVPVVSSQTSAMPEVLGNAALMADPNDSEAFSQKLCDILNNKELAQDLVARGKAQAKKFTWEATAEKTLGAYQQALIAGDKTA